MPDVEYAFLADAADTAPGRKFSVLGGGISQLNGGTFPLRHPHMALVVGLRVTAVETGREHQLRFILLDADGRQLAEASGGLVAGVRQDGRDEVVTFSIDLWNLTFPAPGDYSFRVLVNGSELRRLPLVVAVAEAKPGRPPDDPASDTRRYDA